MRKYLKYVIGLCFLFMIFGCEKSNNLNYITDETGDEVMYIIDGKKFVETEEPSDLVKIEVENNGIIIAELYPDVAPITVSNFKKLIGEQFYDGIIFHRVIKDFMIQTGDPYGTGMGGSAEEIKGEFSINGVENNLSHTRGVLSMARRGPMPGEEESSETMDSASSQFFIVHNDSTFLDGSYAAFGKVIHGMDVVDKIANVATNYNDKPLENQVMLSVRFVNEVGE